MNPIAYLKFLFDTPSAFYDDPLGYARNVALHTALIGAAMALLGFLGGAAVYAAWELAQWRLRKATPSDCVEDWAFVMCGATALLTLDWRIAAIAVAFLLSGYLFRRENRGRFT